MDIEPLIGQRLGISNSPSSGSSSTTSTQEPAGNVTSSILPRIGPDNCRLDAGRERFRHIRENYPFAVTERLKSALPITAAGALELSHAQIEYRSAWPVAKTR